MTELYPRHIIIVKKSSILHKYKNERLMHQIMMRVCSENIGLITDILVNKKEVKNDIL